MLKISIYFNVLLILIISVYLLIKMFKKNTNISIIKKIIIIYFIYNCISFYFIYIDLVDIRWDFIYLLPICLISFIIHIISIIYIYIKNKQKKKLDYYKINIYKYIFLVVAPFVIFIIPYIYELYILNNCDYLLKYNLQVGIIQSDDSYIAIINNKPVTITLQKNLFNRKGISTDVKYYSIVYNNDVEIFEKDSNHNDIAINNEKIKEIALNAKKRNPLSKCASLYHLSEKGYSIIKLISEKSGGIVLGQYFYYKENFIKEINTFGDLKSIIYYK